MGKTRVLETVLSCAGILCALAFQIADADCHTSVWGVQLTNHVMSNLTIGDIDSCYRTCVEKPGCRSVNYYRDKSLCELNSRTMENTPQMTVINEDSVYFKIPDAREQIIMIFPQASLKTKVVLENWLGNLTAFTVCSWNQAAIKLEQALFSFATNEHHNEIYVELEKPSSTTFLRIYMVEWRSPTG
ncbi:uncharacterized protein LOC110248500 [Exaiptasia diaphana]|uniref:Apple domain-containing protein n=1 Tax=Exaiptasia diaphana TaxID=2652724 RepID=A0A913XVY2_EXADI|nr:uncharacterized protein LOC110248500 [Exaiptasia diaphana]KXJ08647.1 hypothetical protein AC249_AIPGENE6391 [Exaiptasia diaphana]